MARGFLDYLGKFYGTDKASGHHDYLGFYERFLDGAAVKTVLEIGVGEGGSLKMWADYFPHATIVGMDKDEGKRERKVWSDRIKLWTGDQANEEHLIGLSCAHAPFDLINDDGGHGAEEQLTSLRVLWPHLARGGFYLLEDIIHDQAGDRLAELCRRIMREQEGDDRIASTCEFAAVFHGTIVMRKK
jgi:cephalosporin hydroxylase